MARPIIIDTDPGIDDAIALLLALASPELEILGITVVAGNVTLETAYLNAHRVVSAIPDKLIPVNDTSGLRGSSYFHNRRL